MLYYNRKNVPLAKQLRRDMTPWERKLWYQFLRTFTPRFQRQKPIGGYIADFYCTKTRRCSASFLLSTAHTASAAGTAASPPTSRKNRVR